MGEKWFGYREIRGWQEGSTTLYMLSFIQLDNSSFKKTFSTLNTINLFFFHQDRTKSPWFVRIYEAPAFLPLPEKGLDSPLKVSALS